MPRLTNDLYYERHRFLKDAWTQFQVIYGVVPMNEQWDVHAYYAPTQELTRDELLEHRATISKAQPSLPQRAGKAFGEMNDVFRWAFEQAGDDDVKFHRLVASRSQRNISVGQPHPKTGRRISIRSIARPEIDTERIARALLAMAREQLAGEKEAA